MTWTYGVLTAYVMQSFWKSFFRNEGGLSGEPFLKGKAHLLKELDPLLYYKTLLKELDPLWYHKSIFNPRI